MKRIIAILLFACLVCLPCFAIKSMMFNSIDQYIKRADGIWIVKTVRRTGQDPEIGPLYQVKVLQTLKGDSNERILTVCSVSRRLISGDRYLVFGFNKDSTKEVWIDNGNISPVPIPMSFSLNELEGKSLKDKISAVLAARHAELGRLIEKYKEEKNALEQGLKFQQHLDNIQKTR